MRYSTRTRLADPSDCARGERSDRPGADEPRQEAILALQRGAGNAAVSRLLARAPAAVETPGHEEAGWARPALRMSDDPVHVATIHFRTKESTLDSSDDAILASLAAAYAPYASRNRFKPKEPQGLRGRVVGYADPRPSAAPDNQKLSEQRAVWTAHHLLRHLVRESGVIPGQFDIERQGAGVAPEAAGGGGKVDAPAAEGNLLAPNRRAEVFLAGEAVESQPEPPKAVDPPDDKRVKPPNLDNWNTKDWQHSDWWKFDPHIERGDKSEIYAMAARMMGVLAVNGSNMDEMLFWLPTAGGVTGHDIPRITPRKPPWWDNRGSELHPTVGRGGMTVQQKLTYKAKLLKRDYIETMKWAEMHVIAPGSSLMLLIEEVKKGSPDQAKIKQYVESLDHLRFMLDATQNLAEEVLKTTG